MERLRRLRRSGVFCGAGTRLTAQFAVPYLPEHPAQPAVVRCTHCRTRFVHDPHVPRPCPECQSQLATYNGVAIKVARNGDGLPIHRLDPKKKKFLIPSPFSR